MTLIENLNPDAAPPGDRQFSLRGALVYGSTNPDFLDPDSAQLTDQGTKFLNSVYASLTSQHRGDLAASMAEVASQIPEIRDLEESSKEEIFARLLYEKIQNQIDQDKKNKREPDKKSDRLGWMKKVMFRLGVVTAVAACSLLGILAWKNRETIEALIEPAPILIRDESGDWVEQIAAPTTESGQSEVVEIFHFPESYEERMSFFLEPILAAQSDVREERWDNNLPLQTLTFYRSLSPEAVEDIKSGKALTIMFSGLDLSLQGPKSHRSDISILFVLHNDVTYQIEFPREMLLARGLDHGGFGDNVNTQTYIPDGYRDTDTILGAQTAMENMCNAMTIATGIPIDACIATTYEGYKEIFDKLIPPEGIQLHFEEGFHLGFPDSPLRVKLGGNGVYPKEQYPEDYYFTSADILDLIRWRKIIIIDDNPKNDDDEKLYLAQRSQQERAAAAVDIFGQVIKKLVVDEKMSLKKILLLANDVLNNSDSVWTNNPHLLDSMMDKLNHSDASQAALAEFLVQFMARLEPVRFVETTAPFVNNLYTYESLVPAIQKEVANPEDNTFAVGVSVKSANGHLTMPFAPAIVNRKGEVVWMDFGRLTYGVNYNLALKDPEELKRLEEFYMLLRMIMAYYYEIPESVELSTN